MSGALSRVVGEDVGGYTITQNTLSAGTNYNIAYNSNPFTITPATLIYLAMPVRVAQGAPFPLFTGSVEGLKGSDTVASATSGTLVFNTSAPDSDQIGLFAIDGGGLAANRGNYVFVQDPTNANALLITPRAAPSLPSGNPSTVVGAIASTSQTESPCAQLREADETQALCAAQMNFRQTQRVNLEPGWRRVIAIDGSSFAREGAGIRLPAGVVNQ